ncbi:glycosyltransferase family 25 protein [Gemmatimonadota bacterium]
MNALLDFRVYVLNYRNPERRESMVRMLEGLGISEEKTHFAEEVDGSLIDRKTLTTDFNYTARFAATANNACIGNALSHLSMLRDMISGNVAQAIVFEDDVIELHQGNTVPLINAICGQLPDCWEVVYLERCHGDCFNDIPFSENLLITQSPTGVAARLISLNGAKKLMFFHETIRTNEPIDIFYKRISPNMFYLASTPMLFGQSAMFSSNIRDYRAGDAEGAIRLPECRNRFMFYADKYWRYCRDLIIEKLSGRG